MKRFGLFSCAVFFAGTLFSQLPEKATVSPKTGDAVPPFHADVVQSPNGQAWDLNSLRGRVVVFNFADLRCPQTSCKDLPINDDAVLVWVTNESVWLAQKRLVRSPVSGWVLADKEGEIRKALGLENGSAALVYVSPSGAIAGYSNNALLNSQAVEEIYAGNTSKLSPSPKPFQYSHPEQTQPRPYYQAEIKQHTGAKGGSRVNTGLGSLVMNEVDLRGMIAQIWQVRLDQIEIPEDLQSGTYDFALTVPQEDEKQLKILAQQAVGAHFGINVAEIQQMDSVYVLKAPKKEAAGLHFVKASCNWSQMSIGMELTGQCVSMDTVSANLSGLLKHPVVNETNLKGGYDIAVAWKSQDAADVIAGMEQAGFTVQTGARPSIRLVVQH